MNANIHTHTQRDASLCVYGGTRRVEWSVGWSGEWRVFPTRLALHIPRAFAGAHKLTNAVHKVKSCDRRKTYNVSRQANPQGHRRQVHREHAHVHARCRSRSTLLHPTHLPTHPPHSYSSPQTPSACLPLPPPAVRSPASIGHSPRASRLDPHPRPRVESVAPAAHLPAHSPLRPATPSELGPHLPRFARFRSPPPEPSRHPPPTYRSPSSRGGHRQSSVRCVPRTS